MKTNYVKKRFVDFLSELDLLTKPAKAWSLVRGLSNRFAPAPKSEALLVKNKLLKSDAEKSDAFVDEYASVNRLSKNADDRKMIFALKNAVRQIGLDKESCSEFTLNELLSATSHMKSKGAAGPD